MTAAHWVTVFDVAQASFVPWRALVAMAAGLALSLWLTFSSYGAFLSARGLHKRTDPMDDDPLFHSGLGDWGRRAFGGVMSLLLVAAFAGLLWSSYDEYAALRAARDGGRFETVEGRVEGFRNNREHRHQSVSFIVGRTRFEYSSDDITAAFNDSGRPSGDGPVRAGMHVRMGYLVQGRDNKILKLEIRK